MKKTQIQYTTMERPIAPKKARREERKLNKKIAKKEVKANKRNEMVVENDDTQEEKRTSSE